MKGEKEKPRIRKSCALSSKWVCFNDIRRSNRDGISIPGIRGFMDYGETPFIAYQKWAKLIGDGHDR